MCLGIYVGTDRPLLEPADCRAAGGLEFNPVTNNQGVLAMPGTAHAVDVRPEGLCGCPFQNLHNAPLEEDDERYEARRRQLVKALADHVRDVTRVDACRLLLCWDGDWMKPAPATTLIRVQDIVSQPHFFDGVEVSPRLFEFERTGTAVPS